MALIAFLSSQPHDGINLDNIPLRDKGVHFVEFAMLAIFNAYALAHSLRTPSVLRVALIAIAMTTIWGYIDEVHQAFVPGRTSDAVDLLADFLGSIAGTSAYLIARSFRRG